MFYCAAVAAAADGGVVAVAATVPPPTSAAAASACGGGIEYTHQDNDSTTGCCANTTGKLARPVPPIVRGHDWSDVAFTDQTETERAVFSDTSDTHGFRVRGASYLEDGIKEHTGPALFRLVVSEFIEVVGERKEGQRYDHIAALGRVKQRLDALRSIAEPPEILVMNYQYPCI
jgi:hypothetical protein